jgi:nucleotidyltransferase/DNA polymerase involved in DNA repair
LDDKEQQENTLLRDKLEIISKVLDQELLAMIAGMDIPPFLNKILQMTGMFSIEQTLQTTNDETMKHFNSLVKKTWSIGLDKQVDFDTFANQFTDDILEFKQFLQSQQKQQTGQNGMIDATTATTAKALDVQST